MKFIALCQSNQQVKWLVQQSKYSENITHWIAANPSAYWELHQRGVSFSTLDEVQKKKSSNVIESLQQEQITWAKTTDAFLQEQIPVFGLTRFCPTQYYLYYLKTAWDVIINRADLLDAVLDIPPSDTFLFFQNPPKIEYNESLVLSGSVLSECVPIWADHHGIHITPLPALAGDMIWQPHIHIRNELRRKITSKFPQSFSAEVESIINDPGLYLRRHVSSCGFFHLPRCKGKIIIRTAYDLMPKISTGLWQKGYDPFPFNIALSRSSRNVELSPLLFQTLDDTWQQVTRLEWFWRPEGWQKWSLRTLLEPLFKHFWFNNLPKLWKSFCDSKIYLEKQRPRALCVPSIWGPHETGFIMAAHNAQIPVIFYQHGACMGDIENSIWDLTDSYYGDYQFVYGEGAANYIHSRRTVSHSRSIPVSIGSVRLDQISQGISDTRKYAIRRSILGEKDRPLVLYVPGAFYNNNFRYDYQDFRNFKVLNLRIRVAALFNQNREVQFAYKAFVSEGHDPTFEMLESICPECTIVHSIPLTELHWAADLIIHEIPGTGMYEGLVTDKPIIVYVDNEIYQMPYTVKKMLGKRAKVAETDQNVIDMVRGFIENKNFSPLLNPDREFIKTFCTHLDNGQSLLRAVNKIEDICKIKRDTHA